MVKTTTKRCHWVSQAYLRHFAADEGKRKVWRFSKNVGDPELRRIDKVAVKFHLYAPLRANGQRDDKLERKLSELERFFGDPVWKAISTGEVDLTWEPVRKLLALIVATTFERNPTQFKTWKSMHAQFVEQISQFDSLPSHVAIGNVTRKVDQASWRSYREASEEDLKAAWNDNVAIAGGIGPVLLDMRMAIVVAKKPAFITSDHPVTIVHPSLEFRGIRDPETKIIFPLSPTRLLYLDNRHNEPDGAYYALSNDNPASANYLVWRNAIDYMFSSRHPDEVSAEMLADAGGLCGY
ncbi:MULTISPECIES: DUF4238 domain-containing protein [Alphaproteobacteria]|uniref:DUF4238 domain-containing protein n=1 Tax=Alphaproteobacteria TaxID=28211 RepID=UPI0032651AF9